MTSLVAAYYHLVRSIEYLNELPDSSPVVERLEDDLDDLHGAMSKAEKKYVEENINAGVSEVSGEEE